MVHVLIRMPWQAMNRMTRGGLRLGQLTIVGGLAHNNKNRCVFVYVYFSLYV